MDFRILELRQLFVSIEMIGCPEVEFPSVIVTEEKDAFVVVRCHFLGEQSFHDGVHLICIAFKEHADSPLEQTVTSEDHLVDPLSLSILHRQNEHVVGSCVARGLKSFDTNFAAKKLSRVRLTVLKLDIGGIDGLVATTYDR